MAFRDTIKNLRHIFDWTVVEVSNPQPYSRFYKDMGDFFLGYKVTVKYKYHGDYEYIFPVDDKIGLVSKERALKRAINFYKQKSLRIRGTR